MIRKPMSDEMRKAGQSAALLFAAIIAWDAFLWLKYGIDGTLSAFMRSAGRESFATAFGVGFLCGHWYLPGITEMPGWFGFIVFAVLATDIALLSLERTALFPPFGHPAWMFLAGVFFGPVFWPLRGV